RATSRADPARNHQMWSSNLAGFQVGMDSAAPHEYCLFDKGGAMEWSKREFLKAGAGAAALAAMPRAFAQWQPSQRYPDPLIKIVDPSFARYRLALAKVERIASGMRWCEGPVWVGDGRYLLWSDIPNNRIMKWEEETGAVSVFRKPSNNANGNTRDRQGDRKSTRLNSSHGSISYAVFC